MGQNESSPPLPANQTELVLTDKGLTALPYCIPRSHPITLLDLSGNNISSFPSELEKLEFLDLSRNNLSCFGPDGITFTYKALKTLHLTGNNFTEIPTPIENMKNLTNLSLDRNFIEKAANFLMNLPKLEHINLFINLLPELPQMPISILTINAGFNCIRQIAENLPNLVELRLPGNRINDISMSCRFPQLTYLDLSLNEIATLPDIKTMAPKLQVLNLSHNFLHEAPKKLPETLTALKVAYNTIYEWTEPIDHLVNLKDLNISYNQMSTIPKLPPNLQKLGVEGNLFTSSSEPITLQNLQNLQLYKNNFESNPDCSGSSISSLLLRENKVTTINCDYISQSMSRFEFMNNLLKTLPNQFFTFRKMQHLNIAHNQIQTLPDTISETNLKTLIISENPISTLPILPVSLLTLHAASCQFTEIPQSVYYVTRLNSLNLSCNQLTKIESLPNIHVINLSNNQITELPQIPDVVTNLDVSQNQLSKFILNDEEHLIQELTISCNPIKELQMSPLLVLHTLKATHINAEFNLDFKKYPGLRTIDITYSSIVPSQPFPVNLKEFSMSNEELFYQFQSDKIRLYQPEKCGYSEICGCRPTQEDSLIIRSHILPDTDIYAVIDGHGGADTANLAAYIIPQYFKESNSQAISTMPQLLRKFNEKLKQDKIRDGAVMVFAAVTSIEVGVANIGDSRALIVRDDGTAFQLTNDHRPIDRAELDLIKSNHSFVQDERTAGILAFSRSMGDFNVEGVSRIPDMYTYRIKEFDSLLVLACDGLYDLVSSDEVAQIIHGITDPNKAANLLRNIAFARGSTDNVSVIVVRLH